MSDRSCTWAVLVTCLLLTACEPGTPAPAPQSVEAPVPVPARVAEILASARKDGPRAVVVNVWATFCKPCRDEFPALVRLRKEYADRGVELVLISADVGVPERVVVRFLSEQGVDFPTWLKVQKDEDFIAALLPAWQGDIPVTLVYDDGDTLRDWWTGARTFEQLASSVDNVLADEPS